MAQPGRGQPDQHLIGAGRIQLDLLDLPLLSQAPEHCSACLHMCLLNVDVSVAVD